MVNGCGPWAARLGPRTPQAPIQLQPVDGLEGAVLLNDGEEDLGEGLDMSVTGRARGICEQFERLKSLGPNFAQGYLIGWPVPIDELERQPQVYRPRKDAAQAVTHNLRRMVPLVAARGAFAYVALNRAILASLI